MSKDDIVTFLLPDGTKISNDPRFDLQEALQESLDSREDTGDAGIRHAEQQAQTLVERPATLNSGQPGVGPNAVPDDLQRELYPLGSPAQIAQAEDLEKARLAKASPNSTSVQDDDPVDSNAKVLEVRETLAADREKYAKMQEQLGEEGAGDPEQPYSEWTGKQLKAEVAKRNASEDRAEEDRLSIIKGMRVTDVADLLDADDARIADASRSTTE